MKRRPVELPPPVCLWCGAPMDQCQHGPRPSVGGRRVFDDEPVWVDRLTVLVAVAGALVIAGALIAALAWGF